MNTYEKINKIRINKINLLAKLKALLRNLLSGSYTLFSKSFCVKTKEAFNQGGLHTIKS